MQTTVPAAPHAGSAAERLAPLGRSVRRSRNLVIVRAGDDSLHEQWGASARRDFDLFVSYFGEHPGRYAEGCDFYEQRRGPKWPCIGALLREQPALLDAYDCIWFPDDDLAADTATVDRMFAFFHAHGVSLAQPALTRDSYCTWRTLRQQSGCQLRFARFVEVMAPLFSRDALRVCAPTFAESQSGWGLDWLWPQLCEGAGLDRIAVIDATPVRHTRPCGGELYRRNPQLTPRLEAQRLLDDHHMHQQRVDSKYGFTKCVRETALPMRLRLYYSLRSTLRRGRYRVRGRH
jgi:hypothetical protein